MRCWSLGPGDRIVEGARNLAESLLERREGARSTAATGCRGFAARRRGLVEYAVFDAALHPRHSQLARGYRQALADLVAELMVSPWGAIYRCGSCMCWVCWPKRGRGCWPRSILLWPVGWTPLLWASVCSTGSRWLAGSSGREHPAAAWASGPGERRWSERGVARRPRPGRRRGWPAQVVGRARRAGGTRRGAQTSPRGWESGSPTSRSPDAT